jgi:hypothetical protein
MFARLRRIHNIIDDPERLFISPQTSNSDPWCPHIVVIISDHVGLVISDLNDKCCAAWSIEAHEALEECGWMRWIDSATPTKEIKDEDGVETNIVEGLCAKALLSQLIA